MVWVAANVQTNKLAFLSRDLAGVEIANSINNAKWLFGSRFFVFRQDAAGGNDQAQSGQSDPTKEVNFFHANTKE
jgi:hypothetical protein